MPEIELKLAIGAAALAPLKRRLARLGAPSVQQVDSIYLDTPGRTLGAQGMALRVRKIGRRWVQTLKTGDAQAALSARGEWEVATRAGRLELPRFPQEARQALAQAGVRTARASRLGPWFRTNFERTAWQVERGDALIEVALDQGEVIAGKARLPILELELELKRGAPPALYALALELVAPRRGPALALLPFGESKAARGARLAQRRAHEATKANAKRITAGVTALQSATEALATVLRNGLDVLLANLHGVLAADDPEFVHQARVALRRMRSAVRLLAKDAELPDGLVEDMHWIAAALGDARDADVLLDETLPPWLSQLPPGLATDAEALLAHARERQAAAREGARAAIGSGRFARFALRLAQWAAWPPKSGDARRLRALAAKRLGKAQDRLLERGRFFVALAPAQRHRVRILAKRLRYALDLFAPALPATALAPYAEALARLQDELGALNDAAVAGGTLPQLTRSEALLQAAQAWFGHAQPQRLQALVEAEASLLALSRLPAPWRQRKGEA